MDRPPNHTLAEHVPGGALRKCYRWTQTGGCKATGNIYPLLFNKRNPFNLTSFFHYFLKFSQKTKSTSIYERNLLDKWKDTKINPISTNTCYFSQKGLTSSHEILRMTFSIMKRKAYGLFWIFVSELPT